MRLCVCNDRPLRTWILGFGGMARVVTPKALAGDILDEIQIACERYMPKLKFEPIRMTIESRWQLPGLKTRPTFRNSA